MNKFIAGSHDISHCSGKSDQCAIKDKCYRYLMYLDAKKKNLKYITIITPSIEEKCEYFWKVN